MKKSTLFLVAAAVTLGVVALIVTNTSDAPTIKKLDIAGFATPAELTAEKSRGLMDPAVPVAHPIDEVILEREGNVIRLVRDGEGEAQKWRFAEPASAAGAMAVKWNVDAMVELFKSPTSRSDARTIKAADFPLFDFEASRRIGLTLKSKGTVWNGVDLIVGQVVKDASPEAEAQTVKGTWVMVKGDETTAFLLAEKDLRTPLDKTLVELRDKKVFAFEADAISKIEISTPTNDKVVLTSTTTEVPPPPDAGPEAKPTKNTTWAISEPAGVDGDTTISGVARTLAGLRVNDFVALDKAAEDAKAAVANSAWMLTFSVGDTITTLRIADGDKDPVWAKIDGKDELLSLSSFTAKSLRKGLDDLKNKTVWDIPQADITELSLKGEADQISLTRSGATWTFSYPALAHSADPSSVLSGVARLSAVRWAKPTELDAARTALASPDIMARVKTATDDRKLTISGVLPADDGAQNRWAVVGDPANNEPFLLSDFNAKRFTSSVAALRNKKLFADLPGLKDQLVAITVTVVGSPTLRFEKPSTGGDFTLVGLDPAETLNDEAMRTLVSTVGALEAKSFHEGKAAADTGLTADKANVVGLELIDGRKVTLLVSTLSSGDGELYALADDGPLKGTPVGINEYQAKNITKPRADFVKPVGP
jgi:hypothetical protein